MFARFCQEYRVTDRPLRVIQGMFGHGFLQIPKSLAESPLPALDVILRIEADRFTVLLRDRDQLRILFLQRLKYRLYRAPHSVAVRVVMGRNVNVRLVRPQVLKRSTRCERIENVRRHSRQSDIHAPHSLAFLRKQPGPADSGAVLARTGAGYVLKEREKVIQRRLEVLINPSVGGVFLLSGRVITRCVPTGGPIIPH